MSAFDMLDDSFPHGTVEGYNRGCKGSQCPAPMACRDVRTRYHADWGFRKAVDAGATAAELLEQERSAAVARVEADRAAVIAEREAMKEAARAEREARRWARARREPRAPRTRVPREPRPSLVADVIRLHGQGLNDTEIAHELSCSRPYVSAVRARHDLPRITLRTIAPAGRKSDRRSDVERLHAEGLRDQEIAEQLGLSFSYVGNIRRELNLPAHRAPRLKSERVRIQRSDRRPDVAAAHAEGLTDRQMSERLGISISEVGRLRRLLGLQVHKSVASRWDNAEKLPHGTNASYARGCRCEPCHQAQREYYREYARRRRAEGIPAEHHGTPYGYQLGCRGRKACTSEVSCTDAMLAQERRRRREAGVSAAPDRVPAEPVRQHVRQLMDAGMTVLAIADTAGVSRSGIKTLMYGRSGERAGEFPAQVEADKAERLLALEVARR